MFFQVNLKHVMRRNTEDARSRASIILSKNLALVLLLVAVRCTSPSGRPVLPSIQMFIHPGTHVVETVVDTSASSSEWPAELEQLAAALTAAANSGDSRLVCFTHG